MNDRELSARAFARPGLGQRPEQGRWVRGVSGCTADRSEGLLLSSEPGAGKN